MISLVSSSVKTSDFISPKDLNDQLPKTYDLLQSFMHLCFFVMKWRTHMLPRIGICVLFWDAYASSRTHMWDRPNCCKKELEGK